MNTKFNLLPQRLCLLLLSVIIIVPGITTAQSAYPECGTVYNPGEAGTLLMRPDPNTSCGGQSAIYGDYFKPKETYIPYNYIDTTPQTVPKKVKIRFMVADPGTPDKKNFKPGDEALLNDMIIWMNDFFLNTETPDKPQTNICGTCYIQDTRIQFELDTIIYFPSRVFSSPVKYDADWYPDFRDNVTAEDSVLNIFFAYYDAGPSWSGITNPKDGIEKYGFYTDTKSTYIVLSNTYINDGRWGQTRILMHELFHEYGLWHLHPGGLETCDENDPEYLADIFNTGSLQQCYQTEDSANAYVCDRGNPEYGNYTCDNNVMARIGGHWVSPMQMGILHRGSFLGRMHRYTYNVDAPNEHPWLVYDAQTWDFPIRMFQDIRVMPAATLTIKCEVQMPPGGRIVVEPGGKLIVDGGHITSYHQRANWSGIETIGNNTMPVQPQYQGSVELKNGAIIENGSLRNFSAENGAQGGGIIKAANSHFYNCFRAVELNGYGKFSYGTNCTFDKCTFTVDKDASYLLMTSTPTTQFTSWDTKNGVTIRNCAFKNEIPYDLHSQKKRGTAIGVAATSLTVINSTFEDFKDGIVSNGYTSIPTRNTLIYNNSFNHITNNITLGAGAYGDVRGNTITNMFNYQDGHTVRIGNGIYLDNTMGSYVGCENNINGQTDGGEWQSTGRAGIIVTNSSDYGATVKDNLFANLGMATQIRKDNPWLSIYCNQYNSNNIAWLVTGDFGHTLQNQGLGCAPWQTRAGNLFYGNAQGIVNYLEDDYDYYVFSGSGGGSMGPEYPVNSINLNTGGGLVIYSCSFTEASDPNSQCNQFTECDLMLGRGLGVDRLSVLLEESISRFRELDGWKSTASEAQILAGDIVRIYNELDNTSGIQSFLEEASGTINNDNAYKLLIPLYIETAQYGKATEAVEGLTLSDRERLAYTSYYTIIGRLKAENRRIDALTPEELNTVTALADEDLEVSAFAKGLLESGYQKEWLHIIDDEPLTTMSISRNIAGIVPGDASRLGEAVPNPANGKVTIQVYITMADAESRPSLVLRDLSGKEVISFKLKEGNNSIEMNTRNFSSGLYFYSMLLNGSVKDTKKLSVVP